MVRVATTAPLASVSSQPAPAARYPVTDSSQATRGKVVPVTHSPLALYVEASSRFSLARHEPWIMPQSRQSWNSGTSIRNQVAAASPAAPETRQMLTNPIAADSAPVGGLVGGGESEVGSTCPRGACAQAVNASTSTAARLAASRPRRRAVPKPIGHDRARRDLVAPCEAVPFGVPDVIPMPLIMAECPPDCPAPRLLACAGTTQLSDPRQTRPQQSGLIDV